MTGIRRLWTTWISKVLQQALHGIGGGSWATAGTVQGTLQNKKASERVRCCHTEEPMESCHTYQEALDHRSIHPRICTLSLILGPNLPLS